MREKLALERWHDNATTWWKRAIFPWRFGFSPIAAFRRECPTDLALTVSPARYVVWIIVAFVAFAVASNLIIHTVDTLRGVYSVFGFDRTSAGWRHCSIALLPVQLPIIWLQSLVVCLLGMVIGWRVLKPRQVLYLTTWVMGLGLMAGTLATLYEIAWDTFLLELLAGLTDSMLTMRIFDVVCKLEMRSFDLFFGLLAGLAVGTVVGRRRWLVAMVAAVILYAAFPIYVQVQGRYGYMGLVYIPLRDAMQGDPLPPPDLSDGPSFATDEAEPLLAGRWEVNCWYWKDMAITEIVIDETGTLTHFRIADPTFAPDVLFIADGESHEIEVTGWSGNPCKARYRCFGGCSRTDSNVEVNTRLEWYVRMGGPDSEEDTTLYEQALIGRLNDAADTIKGTNKFVVDSRSVVYIHPRRERSFSMKRLPPLMRQTPRLNPRRSSQTFSEPKP